MIKAAIFDMYETLITLFESPLYFGTQMAEDAKIPVEEFQKLWQPTEHDRTIGKVTLEEMYYSLILILFIYRLNKEFKSQRRKFF